jgi:hypothetical protein
MLVAFQCRQGVENRESRPDLPKRVTGSPLALGPADRLDLEVSLRLRR